MPNQPNRSALSLKPVLMPLVYTMVTPRSSSIITGGDEGLHAASRYNHPVTAPIAAPNARAAATATSALTSMPTIDAATAPVSASRADGQIDPRGQYDQRHPYRHNGVNGGLLQNIEQVIDGKSWGSWSIPPRSAPAGQSAILLHQPRFCEIAATRNSGLSSFLLLIHTVKLAHSGSHQYFGWPARV